MRKQLVMKLGENISIRRAQLIETHPNSLVIYIMEKLQFYLMHLCQMMILVGIYVCILQQ